MLENLDSISLKTYGFAGNDAGTYFYNTRKNNCVDFVLQIGRACMVDIGYAEDWSTPGGLAKWIMENVLTDSGSGN